MDAVFGGSVPKLCANKISSFIPFLQTTFNLLKLFLRSSKKK